MPLQKYDIAIGDITIRYNRTLYVDFTIPYTESGVAMIVPVKDDNNNMWIFLKPLSSGMWFGSIILFIYTGSVVWLLERLNGNGHVHGPFSLKQLGILMFFSIFEESWVEHYNFLQIPFYLCKILNKYVTYVSECQN